MGKKGELGDNKVRSKRDVVMPARCIDDWL